MSAPHAPWTIGGECVVAFVRRPRPVPDLPDGFRPLPGPHMVVAASYADSPVGPYLELGVARPARLGARPGLCFTTMVVTSTDSRVGGRLNWGFPKELGTLRWSADGDERELWWEERGIVLRGRPTGPALPVLAGLRSLQRRSDGPVVVPGRVRGRARWGRVEIKVPEGDALAGLAGPHRGVVMGGMRLVVHPARSPRGLASTLRAPLRAPEPALSDSLPPA